MNQTILMIHGFACGGDMWSPLAKALEARSWRCEAPTLFEHLRTIGAAPDALKQLALSDFVRAAEDFARRLEDEDRAKPIIMGHGMGALIAQKLIARQVASAGVFIAPYAPTDCGPAFRSGAVAFANILLTPPSERILGPVKPWRQGLAWGIFNGLDKQVRDPVLDRIRHESGRLFNELEALDKEEAGVGSINTADIYAPTLTLAAGRDRVTPLRIASQVAAKYAQAPCPGEFKEFAEAGHWMVDGANLPRLVDTVDKWLKSRSVRTRRGAEKSA